MKEIGMIVIAVVGVIVMLAVTLYLRLGKRGRKNVKNIWRL